MDKDVVHVSSGIFLGHKKWYNWVIYRNVDRPKDCREVNQKEKNIPYINEYMWHLEKWDRWAYWQGRNTDADVENGHADMVGREEWNKPGQ